MDTTKTLKTTSGYSIGLGALGIIVTVIVLIIGAVLLGTKEDSSYLKALASSPNFSQLSERFAAEGYSNAEGMRIVGIGAMVIAVFILISALFNIARGILGFKAANYGTCISGAMVLGIIAIIFDALGLISALLGSAHIIVKVVYFLMSVLYVYSLVGVKRDFEDRKMFEAAAAINNTTVSTDDEAAKFFGN